MANSPGGKDRLTDNNHAPVDNDRILTHPSANPVTRSAPSSSRMNTTETHSPAVKFNLAESMGYMGLFSHLQSASESCMNPEETVNLAQIENQNHIVDQSYSKADNDEAATDNTGLLADKPGASMPTKPKVQRQVFNSIEDAANSSTNASDKVGTYVRARGKKKLTLEAYERQLNNSRELIKQYREDAKDAALTEQQLRDASERMTTERQNMLRHLDKVQDLQDDLRMEKRDEAARRVREGGPELSECEQFSDDDAGESEDFDVKEELIDDGFTPIPIADKKRKAADKVDGAAKPKKLKATDEADDAVETGTPKVSKKTAPSLLQSVFTSKKKGKGKQVDSSPGSENEDKSAADRTDTDADNNSEGGGGESKSKRKERAISATNPKSITYTDGIPIPQWDDAQRKERSRRSDTVKSFSKGNEHAENNVATRQRKDALVVIDRNTTALGDGREPASYRSTPHDGNYDYWNIIYLQNEAYRFATKGGSKALKLLKSAGGSLDPLSNTEDPRHEEYVKQAVDNLQQLYKSMKYAADKAAASADKTKGSQSKMSATEATAKRKRDGVWEKLRKSNVGKSLDGASDFDGDSSSTSTIG